MNKKLSILISLLLVVGCQWNQESSTDTTERYLSFSIVTQEFGYTTEGIATINQMIDIHEQYNVPLDVIVDDASMQVYATEAPEVIARLKTSPVVAVSYHVRPPFPYYKKFDFAGLTDLSDSDLYDRILQYEEHGVDLMTGEPRTGPGGYQFVKDQIGYAPIMAGLITEPDFAPTLLQIYAEKGAQLIIEHRDSPIEPNQYRGDLMLRPETVPLIFTEHLEDSPEELIADQFINAPAVTGPVFMSIKTHDNDFFATQSAWLSVYYHQEARGTPQPPFDLSVHDQFAELLSAEEQTKRWDQYEAAVQYASEHQTDFTLINAKQLANIATTTPASTATDTTISNTTSTDQPVIYLTLVSHNEEPGGGKYPNFVENESLFWNHHAAVVEFAQAVTTAGAKYDWQSDWNFLEAVAKYDHGTEATAGKNLVQYLQIDLGVEVDPHAHETIYNYADVAYRIAQLGIEPSQVAGGFLVTPVEKSKLEYLWEPITSTLDPTYTWQATLLWGGGSPNHVNDYNVAGIWKPTSTADYLIHRDNAPVPDIGGYTSSWEGLDDLLAKQAAGELEAGHMYTAAVMVNQTEMLDTNTITDTVTKIHDYDEAVASGALVWVTLEEALAIWEEQYDSQPTIYQADSTIPTHGQSSETDSSTQLNNDKNNCGNGVCEPFERKAGLCPTDCQ